MNASLRIVRSLCFVLFPALLLPNCNVLGLSEEETDNTPLLAAIAVLASQTVYTLDSTTGCVSGVASQMDSSLPAWIRNNFKCSVGTTSGSNYVFTARNLPNTASYYYGVGSPLYEALPSGNTPAGSNQIISQNLTYTVPATPTVNGGAKTSTQGGLVSIGITVNGLAVFNNAAAPGDTLASEVGTFDNFNGHPQQAGVYHHHANPKNITVNDASLVGIALDGYPIYGLLCDQATTSTGDDAAPGTGTPALDAYHGHTANTIHFPGGTYHYHFAYDSTATINTLMGSSFNGNIGSVSNN